MTIEQVTAALKSVGACFAVTSAKTVLPNDGFGAKPSYHIHPNCANPEQRSIVRLSSLKEIQAYVAARKAADRATDEGAAIDIMDRFWSRNS